jgi:hypothetical protein
MPGMKINQLTNFEFIQVFHLPPPIQSNPFSNSYLIDDKAKLRFKRKILFYNKRNGTT